MEAKNKRKLHPYEVDWNVALQRIDAQAEFLNRDEMAKIVKELREILGEGFLIRAFHSGFALAQSFKFITVWHKSEVREFYALLKECASFKNYDEVLAKIKQGKLLPQIREGLTQLRTAFFFGTIFMLLLKPT